MCLLLLPLLLRGVASSIQFCTCEGIQRRLITCSCVLLHVHFPLSLSLSLSLSFSLTLPAVYHDFLFPLCLSVSLPPSPLLSLLTFNL